MVACIAGECALVTVMSLSCHCLGLCRRRRLHLKSPLCHCRCRGFGASLCAPRSVEHDLLFWIKSSSRHFVVVDTCKFMLCRSTVLSPAVSLAAVYLCSKSKGCASVVGDVATFTIIFT